jgi:tetratricopeptide (TPR) repeat protein
MEKSKIFKAFVLMMLFLFLFLNGCAPVKYVMNWFSPAGYDSAYGNGTTAVGLSASEIEKAYKRACYFQEQKKYELSVNEFKKVVANNPGHALAYNGMGVSYDLMGDYENAAQSYQQALALDQGLDYVHNNLGYCYSLQARTDKAIEEYKKAIDLNPEAGKYHNNLGKAYAQNGDYELALAEFKKTTDESEAYVMLANILYKKGLYNEARAQFAAASRLNPDAADITNGLKASTKLAKINQNDIVPAEEKADSKNELKDDGLIIAENDTKEPYAVSSIDSSVKYISPEGAVIVRQQIVMDAKEEAETVSSSMVMDQPVVPIISRDTVTITVEEAVISPAEDKGAVTIEKALSIANNSTGEVQKDEPIVIASLMPSSTNVVIETIADTYPASASSKDEDNAPSVKSLSGLIVQLISDSPDHPMLKKIAARLIKKGFIIEKMANGGRYGRSETKLYYCQERLQEAYQAAKSVPGYQNMDKLECQESDDHVIKVVIGRDLIPATQNIAENIKSQKLGS